MLQELPGIWAYIKWENDGCPNRSQEESDAEYQRGIQVQLLFTQCMLCIDSICLMVCQRAPSLFSRLYELMEMRIRSCN